MQRTMIGLTDGSEVAAINSPLDYNSLWKYILNYTCNYIYYLIYGRYE